MVGATGNIFLFDARPPYRGVLRPEYGGRPLVVSAFSLSFVSSCVDLFVSWRVVVHVVRAPPPPRAVRCSSPTSPAVFPLPLSLRRAVRCYSGAEKAHELRTLSKADLTATLSDLRTELQTVREREEQREREQRQMKGLDAGVGGGEEGGTSSIFCRCPFSQDVGKSASVHGAFSSHAGATGVYAMCRQRCGGGTQLGHENRGVGGYRRATRTLV